MTSETPCLPGCGCVCGHDNDWHAVAVGACRSREHCNCSKFVARAHAPNCPNAKPAEPQSEPRIEHRDVCHASYPCEDCGKVRSRAEGGTTFTVCDDCWDKRQSEPPIADGVGVGIANLFMGHEAETAGKVLARAYLSLKAERDGLKASITKRDEIDASNLTDYNALLGENAALKARMEELSESLLWATSSYEERVVILANREKRKEQEATNAR